MAKKKIGKKYNKNYSDFPFSFNTFDGGGEMSKGEKVGNALAAASGGLGGIVQGFTDNAALQDTSEIEGQIDELSNKKFDASSTSDLLSQYTDNIDKSYSGSDLRQGIGTMAVNTLKAAGSGASAGMAAGPWGALAGAVAGTVSGIAGGITGAIKAKNKAAELNKDIAIANNLKNANFNIATDNLSTDQLANSLANYSALGGPINKFALGGKPETNGMLFDNGITEFDNGGSHEVNPNGGIPVSVDNNGIPNLVEEGEVKQNDYIFSDRLLADENLLNKYKLPKKYKEYSFAKIAKEFNKKIKELPNDFIAKNSLNDSMMKLRMAQEEVRNNIGSKNKKGNIFKGGGPTRRFYNNLHKYYNNAQSPEYYTNLNPAQLNFDGQNNEDTLLSNLMSYNSRPTFRGYDFGNEIYNTPIQISTYDTPQQNINIVNPSQSKTNKNKEVTTFKRPIGLTSFGDDYLYSVPQHSKYNNDILSSIKERNNKLNPYGFTMSTDKQENSGNNNTEDNNQKTYPTWLRYAPAVGGATEVIQNLIEGRDYSGVNAIKEATANLRNVDYKPIGEYLTYKPFDRNYYGNKLNAMATATRRAITNSGNGNTPSNRAALLAADYNFQNNMGSLARQAEEYNLAQRERVAGFNRGTDQFNSQMDLQAQAMNQRNDEMRLRGALYAAQMKDRADMLYSQSLSNGLTNIFDTLGDIGWENFNANMANTDNSQKYNIDLRGRTKHKRPKRNKNNNNNYSNIG